MLFNQYWVKLILKLVESDQLESQALRSPVREEFRGFYEENIYMKELFFIVAVLFTFQLYLPLLWMISIGKTYYTKDFTVLFLKTTYF